MSTTTLLLNDLLGPGGLKQIDIERLTGIAQPRLSKWRKGAPQAADDALKIAALHREYMEAIQQRLLEQAKQLQQRIAASTPEPA